MNKFIFFAAYSVSYLTCLAKPSLEWNKAEDFSDGLAQVSVYSSELKQRMHGFIDREGTFQIPLNADWEDVKSFSEGVAFFKKGSLWGLINKSGDVVAKPQWVDVRGNYKFSDGLAIVGMGGEEKSETASRGGRERTRTKKVGIKWGFIDPKGELVVEPKWDSVREFSDDLGRVYVSDKYGFIDRSGVLQIEPVWSFSGNDGMGWPTQDFYDGLARIEVDGKYGFIDKKGAIAVPPKWEEALAFSEGLAAVRHGKRWGYIKSDGSVAIPPKEWKGVGQFHKGLARVDVEDGSGFIDKNGKLVVPPIYRVHLSGMDGVGFGHADILHLTSKEGPKMLSPTPEVVSLPEGLDAYSLARPSEGMMAVRRAEEWGFVDIRGNIVIPFTNSYSAEGSQFKEGLAKVSLFPTSPPPSSLSDAKKKAMWVRANSTTGFIDQKGKVVIQPKIIGN